MNKTVGKSEQQPALPSRRYEARKLLLIAGPLIAAYLSDFAMTLTTKAIVGQLGYRELASVGLAGDLSGEILIIVVGVLSVVGVLVAQAEGAGRKMEAGAAARQGLIVSTLFGIPAAVLVWHLDSILVLTGQDPDIIDLMGPYLHPLAAGFLPLLWFFVLRIFLASLARTGAVMVITIAAVGLNYILCSGLVTGAFGMPALGVAGAGWAKSIVSVFMLLALLVYTFRTPSFRDYRLFHGRLKVDLSICREIVRLGLPVGGLVILEAALFAAVSIFSGILGAIQLATYQVIIAWVGIAFMTSHGLAEAGMVRVAYAAGRGSVAASRQSGLLTFAMGVVWLTLLAVVPLNFPGFLVGIFLDPADPGFDAVLTLTSRLLILAAFFQVFDGLQVMASLSLRGLKDTIVPLLLGGIGYWVFGIAGGWFLAFPLGMDADGLWWGMAAGLTVTGSLLALRFWWLTRNGHAAAGAAT